MKPKIIVILGPTAVGKSDLAVEIAHQYNGEVISADSRQVYTGLDIGTGKITKKEMRSIHHHMLDIVNPKKVFTVSDYKKIADQKIKEIIARGHTPIICGGTGFYIQSIVDNIVLPEVKPNKELRKKLEEKSAEELFVLLKKLDPKRASGIKKEQGEKNPVRLIRAIEIATALGSVPKIKKTKSSYDFIQIGLILPLDTLREKIHTRLLARIKKGMLKEVENLHAKGLSWKRMEDLGLEYKYIALYLQKKMTKQEMLEKLDIEIGQYARRQMQWFKRDKRIHWFEPTQTKEIHVFIKDHGFDSQTKKI